MAALGSRLRHTGLALLALVVLFSLLLQTPLEHLAIVDLAGDVLDGPVLAVRNSLLHGSTANFSLADRQVLHARTLKEIESATDEVYTRAIEKGKLLMCWMKNPSAAGSQASSKWNDYADLETWGWKETTTTHHGGERAAGMSDIVGLFDPDDWTNENKIVRFEHKGQHPDQEVTKPDGSRVTMSYPVSYRSA